MRHVGHAVNLLAIDQGSRAVGFAYFAGDDVKPASTDLVAPRSGLPWIERMQYVDEQLRRCAGTRGWLPDVVAIEDVVFGRSIRDAVTMGENRGWLMRTTWELFPRARRIDIHPSTTKAAARARTARAVAKGDIARAVQVMTGLRDLSEDEADATAIGWAAFGKLREERFARLADEAEQQRLGGARMASS
jgi:Holliday junction resolvasome RuvABC endonuclease subunit